jgi:hypothetical protein
VRGNEVGVLKCRDVAEGKLFAREVINTLPLRSPLIGAARHLLPMGEGKQRLVRARGMHRFVQPAPDVARTCHQGGEQCR